MSTILSNGIRIWYSTDGKVTFVEVADVERMSEPAVKESSDIAVNTLTSTAQQFLPGMIDGGTLEFSQYWTKTRYAALDAQYGKVIDWKVSYPDATVEANKSKIEFKGYINRLGHVAAENADTPVAIQCRVKVTGDVTFTPGL